MPDTSRRSPEEIAADLALGDPSAALARRTEQEAEYGTWVAVAAIDHGVVRAYNIGDPVPASNVVAHGYDTDGLVAKRGTKAANAALGLEG